MKAPHLSDDQLAVIKAKFQQNNPVTSLSDPARAGALMVMVWLRRNELLNADDYFIGDPTQTLDTLCEMPGVQVCGVLIENGFVIPEDYKRKVNITDQLLQLAREVEDMLQAGPASGGPVTYSRMAPADRTALRQLINTYGGRELKRIIDAVRTADGVPPELRAAVRDVWGSE